MTNQQAKDKLMALAMGISHSDDDFMVELITTLQALQLESKEK